MYQAVKRYDVQIINYTHVHLLIRDTGNDSLSKTIQLAEGRVAQAYNQRKERHGAFWEGRFHAKQIEGPLHLFNCLVYIDLNMVRAGVVSHPEEWVYGGYHESLLPRQRYRIIDVPALLEVTQFHSLSALMEMRDTAITQAITPGELDREAQWTNSAEIVFI